MNNIHSARLLAGTGTVKCDVEWHMHRHFHPSNHELIVVTKGRYHVTIGEENFHARAGDILFYPQGIAHEEWAEPKDPAETLFIGFSWDDCPDDFPKSTHDSGGRVRQLLSWIYQDRDLNYDHKDEQYQRILHLILTEILRLSSVSQDDMIYSLRNYMRLNIESPIRLEDLARQAGMSKYYFLRRYKALTGHTPMEDLRRLRMEKARNLILTTNLPLKDVAPRSGLGDEYHLSRLFKKYFGMPPGELRREVRPKRS
jgi:AraC-like DNA-binding protein